MASIISAGTTSGTALNMTADTSGQLQLATGASATTAVTIDTSQNVGIGTTPSVWYSDYKVLQMGQGSTFYGRAATNETGINQNLYRDASANFKYIANGYAASYTQLSGGGHAWFTAPNNSSGAGAALTLTQAMTLDSSGNVLVGTTTATGARATINGTACLFLQSSGVSNSCIIDKTNTGGSLIQFTYNSSLVGNITTTGSATAYNTSSDYRLKDNIVPMTGALDKVAQLKPVTYTWKADNSAGQGFIAHELQAVVPDCVSGTKDAVDAEGKPVYQGVDTSFLVATLTAAIQEQQTIINDLKVRIETLEAK